MADIRVSEDCWASSILPEGLVERWLVADGAAVRGGDAIVQVRIEDALHDVSAPCDGRLTIGAIANCVIEPGMVLGQVHT